MVAGDAHILALALDGNADIGAHVELFVAQGPDEPIATDPAQLAGLIDLAEPADATRIDLVGLTGERAEGGPAFDPFAVAGIQFDKTATAPIADDRLGCR